LDQEAIMSLKLLHSIDLPEHIAQGGFDHAAVHPGRRWLYLAHTVNNAIDVIDCETDRYLHSIPGLTGVAGALVSEERGLVFTSNRGEDTVGIFSPDDEPGLARVSVGVRPNGLSFDPQRGLLLAANVGNPEVPGSFTVSIVDIQKKEMVASIQVPGRTRWTIFDAQRDEFFVNIADPARIVAVAADHPDRVAREMKIPAAGPHGLDLDPATGRLFCACDAGTLVSLEAASGKVLGEAKLSGKPDVIFYNPALKHLYVAVGDPGVIDVFDTDTLKRLEVVLTGKGAHTTAFDPGRNKLYAFLPQDHSAQVFVDE
jgi:DNA-binding beta-propeller fold protein YncE